jgi:L-amino acid N-acyltransferase YncA
MLLFMNNEIADMEEERKWFERSTKAGMLYLVARVDGKVIGGASIHPRTDKRAHTAEFGIYIRYGYRNLGLGTIMTKAFVEIAKKHGIEILQLSVYARTRWLFMSTRNAGSRNVVD